MTSLSTILIESRNGFNNSSRLEDLAKVLKHTKSDIVVFPAGYITATNYSAHIKYKSIEEAIPHKGLVCVGVDGLAQKPWPRDQTAIAVSRRKIRGAARKFYATQGEKGSTLVAPPFLKEQGHSRIVSTKGKDLFLAVCYDSFGIRRNNMQNPSVDAIINPIHGFFPQGKGNSGDSYFARHGLAGASKQWDVPIFAATVFYDRAIPENWPSAVMWDQGDMSTTRWKYSDNAIQSLDEYRVDIEEGSALIKTYEF